MIDKSKIKAGDTVVFRNGGDQLSDNEIQQLKDDMEYYKQQYMALLEKTEQEVDVERVARAIYDANPAYYSGTTKAVSWEDAAPPYKQDAFREAHAAIAAMKGNTP
jgi:hypothetical protein